MGLKKWMRIGFALLLTAAVIYLVGLFRYYPQYQQTREPVPVQQPQEEGIRLMSQNLRCLTPLDLGKRSWFYRAPKIVSRIRHEAPGIIGFQEATSWQYDYLRDVLTDFDSVITYRDDSVLSEGCPIFYNKTRYTLVEEGSFWLSETPETMSKSWGSKEYRICSYLVLKDNRTGREFAVFNTHLDHVSDEARIGGMRVILDRLSQWEDMPYVIMGDLNAEEGSQTYEMATENCLDACRAAETATEGPTYQDWGRDARRLDYFMVSPEGITVERYAVLPADAGGSYISDHNAIVTDIVLDRLRVMTYNIRLITNTDQGDRHWNVRRERVVEDILTQKPGVLCLQEVKPKQQAYLEKHLKDYDSYMVYRDNKEDSEGCPIFWDKELYTPVDKGCIWLSRTPETVSKDWNSAHYRICTYVILKDLQTEKEFGVFNIHLDHVSAEAKVKGMAVALELMEQYPDLPKILTGDYNAQPDSLTYRLVTRHLEDGLYVSEKASGFGTYFKWGKLEQGVRIDYIMVSPSDFRILQYHVIPALRDGIYSSDHNPVVMDAILNEIHK